MSRPTPLLTAIVDRYVAVQALGELVLERLMDPEYHGKVTVYVDMREAFEAVTADRAHAAALTRRPVVKPTTHDPRD